MIKNWEIDDISLFKEIVQDVVLHEYNRLVELRKVSNYNINMFENYFMNYESASYIVLSYIETRKKEIKRLFRSPKTCYNQLDESSFRDFLELKARNYPFEIPALSKEENRRRWKEFQSRLLSAKDIFKKSLHRFNGL